MRSQQVGIACPLAPFGTYGKNIFQRQELVLQRDLQFALSALPSVKVDSMLAILASEVHVYSFLFWPFRISHVLIDCFAAAFDKLALLHQRSYRVARRLYQERRNAAVKQPDQFLSLIIDTMDQAKLQQPHYKIVPSNIKNMVCTLLATVLHSSCKHVS
jgi:hypothetical protein